MHSISLKVSRDQFMGAATRLAQEHGADLLLSGPGYPGEHRSIIALAPEAELIIDPQTSKDEIKTFCFNSPGPAIGWLAYELGLRFYTIKTNKSASLIQGHLKKYAALLTYNARTTSCHIQARDSGRANFLVQTLKEKPPLLSPAAPILAAPVPSLSREAYMARVRRTLELIREGQTYQLNLSIRFAQHAPNLDSLALFLDLFRRYPAPFYAWFSSKNQRILSTSPERFLKVKDGRVLSQPIKGTTLFETYSPALKDALRANKKERAELSMIVDLIRNDISQHCVYGSVQVQDHRSIFQVDNLLQMYSNVVGVLRDDSDCLDLLFAAFPGGSVTGCPKKRALELIDTLEPHTRGVYCGTVVYIEDEQNMDSSICIRTAVHDLDKKSFCFYAGSGIVVNSNPEREYCETLAKAKKFLPDSSGLLGTGKRT